ASNSETIEERAALGETMMLGLRLVQDGVDADAFGRRHGQTLDEAFGVTIEELIGLGMLQRNERSVRLTQRGLMIANDVVARFL
nr:coproporphyrinogen III oxidase family protein [Chloroflexia bacterium]